MFKLFQDWGWKHFCLYESTKTNWLEQVRLEQHSASAGLVSGFSQKQELAECVESCNPGAASPHTRGTHSITISRGQMFFPLNVKDRNHPARQILNLPELWDPWEPKMCNSLASHQVRPQNFQPEACSFTMARPLSAQGLAGVLRPDKILGNFFLKLGTGHLCN